MNKSKLAAFLLSLVLLLSLAVLPAGAEGLYTDVAENAWYGEAVAYCAARGLMDGVGGGRFDPGAVTTRAMAVTVLYRLSGKPNLGKAEAFPDVAAGAWYEKAVAWAAAEGITQGRADGSFAPEEPVTRQDLTVFLWRSLGCPVAAAQDSFTDEAEISAYALEAVRWAKAAGVMDGMGDGSFAPKAGATRAQLANILMKLDQGLLGIGLLKVTAAPAGLALGEDGALLATDTLNHCVWQMKDGETTLLAGGESPVNTYSEPVGGYVDAAPEESLFRKPWAIAPYLEGWAVADTGNNALRLITQEDVQTINAVPATAGLPSGSLGVSYDRPMGLAADDEGNLYVADTGSGSILVLNPQGRASLLLSGLDEPTGLCWYGGSLYVAETGAHRILKVTEGVSEVLAGSGEEGYADGAAGEAQFSSPMGVAVDGQGQVYVADTVNGAVRRIADGQVVTLLLAKPDSPQRSPVSPTGILAAEGKLYISDNYTGRLLVIPIG